MIHRVPDFTFEAECLQAIVQLADDLTNFHKNVIMAGKCKDQKLLRKIISDRMAKWTEEEVIAEIDKLDDFKARCLSMPLIHVIHCYRQGSVCADMIKGNVYVPSVVLGPALHVARKTKMPTTYSISIHLTNWQLKHLKPGEEYSFDDLTEENLVPSRFSFLDM